MASGNLMREMLSSFDIEDFMSWEGLEYKVTQGSRGLQVNARDCPCCGDNKWRVYFSAEIGAGNCFHCNENFNKWTFAKAHYGLTKSSDVADKINDFVKKMGWRPKKNKRVVTGAVNMDTENVKLPSHLLKLPTKDGSNLRYIEDRGITVDYANYFNLHFCFAGGKWEYIREDGEKAWVNFEDRVIIPIFDLNGKLVTFQGRDITGKAEKKYLFPSRLPGTGRFLYNGHNAMIFKAKEAILNEGPFDVFATKMAIDADKDIKRVVAIGSFGKNLSFGNGETQLNNFRRLKQNGLEIVTIMWDGEKGALSSGLVAAERLTKIGLKVRIAVLPQDKDPADVTGDVVRRCWRNAKDYTKSLATRYTLQNPYK